MEGFDPEDSDDPLSQMQSQAMRRQIQDLFIRTLVLTARLTEQEPEDVAEILATPEKSEEYHKKVLEAMEGLQDVSEELGDAVKQAKEEMEEQE